MRHCEVCGKTAGRGNHKVESGKPKYLGGNGRKTRGITKRYYHVNLQNVKCQTVVGPMFLRVCTKCIRANRITKAIVRSPFTIAAAPVTPAVAAN